jgi:RNA polymerase sigma-70 factor (ECF subfamily)
MTLQLTAPSLVRLSPNAAADRAMLELLVSRLRTKDDAVIDRVLRELVPEVRRWMFRHLGPRADVDDAAQDALSEIAGALHRFEGRSSLVTLAHRIAVRVSYRYYGKPQRETAAMALEPLDVEDQVSARRALARLHRALAQLPERRRAAFVLCAIEGMDPSEAADVLEVSANAMRSLLCRAREELDAILENDDELGRPR